jgi:diguanylate cyclase (GGDEF)-like protein
MEKSDASSEGEQSARPQESLMPIEPTPAAGLWSVFDRLFDAVIIVDRDGRLVYANQSFRQLSDVTSKAVEAGESARDYIELPSECWEPLSDQSVFDEHSARYREVGFITKNGSLGRAQVHTGAVQLEGFASESQLFSLVIRDVSIEDRIHAKYKVQVEANERLKSECERIADETSFLRRMMADLPAYNDKTSMLEMVAGRLKAEVGCREVYFFHVSESMGAIEPIGNQHRQDGRASDVMSQLEPILRDHRGESVRSAMLEPQGQAWITFCRPRLERTMAMVVCPRAGMRPSELRPFFESLAAQLSSCLDNHAFFFQAQLDAASGLFNHRFFDSRMAIECQRSNEQHSPLSLMILELGGLKPGREGDSVLHAVGQALKRRIRGADFIGRVGDSRFGILLPETTSSDALLLAESLRHTLAGFVELKLNCGISSFSWNSDTAETFFRSAEAALAIAVPQPKAA